MEYSAVNRMYKGITDITKSITLISLSYVKSKQNNTNKNKLIDTEKRSVVTREEGCLGLKEKGEGVSCIMIDDNFWELILCSICRCQIIMFYTWDLYNKRQNRNKNLAIVDCNRKRILVEKLSNSNKMCSLVTGVTLILIFYLW